MTKPIEHKVCAYCSRPIVDDVRTRRRHRRHHDDHDDYQDDVDVGERARCEFGCVDRETALLGLGQPSELHIAPWMFDVDVGDGDERDES